MTIPPSLSSSSEPALSACFRDATATLERLGTAWALIGAFAALAFRPPRPTADIDFLVAAAEGLPEALQERGFDVTVHREEDEVWFVRARRDGVRVEFLVAQVEYQRVALERAVDHVITAEDVIVHKLIAWRPRDQDDVATILRQPGLVLDEAYIERWAQCWEVLDRWQAARGSGA